MAMNGISTYIYIYINMLIGTVVLLKYFTHFAISTVVSVLACAGHLGALTPSSS